MSKIFNMSSAKARHAADRDRTARSLVSGGGAGRSILKLAEETWFDEWDMLRRVERRTGREGAAHQTVLVDQNCDHPVSRAFALLRTRLVRTLEQNGWNRIAVCAPTSGCGSTFSAVNLALSISRVPDTRTVLVDLNQRAPGVAGILGIGGTHAMNDFLSGHLPAEEHMVRCSETLALALNSEINPEAAEQLHDTNTGLALERMQEALDPDIILYDLPPMLEYDDLAAFLPNVDGVLLISDGSQTTKAQIEECERILEGQTRLLGVVLNKGRS